MSKNLKNQMSLALERRLFSNIYDKLRSGTDPVFYLKISSKLFDKLYFRTRLEIQANLTGRLRKDLKNE